MKTEQPLLCAVLPPVPTQDAVVQRSEHQRTEKDEKEQSSNAIPKPARPQNAAPTDTQ